MSDPITVNDTGTKVANVNRPRAIVRFQNVGKTTIYIKKIPLLLATTTISDTDYQVKLHADPGESGKGDSFETNSINAFLAISDKRDGLLAVYETIYLT